MHSGTAIAIEYTNDLGHVEHKRLIEFSLDHLDNLNGRISTIHGREYVTDQEREMYRKYMEHGMAFTMIDESKDLVLGIGGCVPVHKGVGELWALVSDDARRYPKFTTLTAYGAILAMQRGLGLHRMQAKVLRDYTQGVKWLRFMGFTIEGPLNKFGPNGEDFWGMARWKW